MCVLVRLVLPVDDVFSMGKTIQMIALLIADRKKPNLVVAPTVAIMQWRNEIEAHTDGLKVLVWYGPNRESSKSSELEKYDVVSHAYLSTEMNLHSPEGTCRSLLPMPFWKALSGSNTMASNARVKLSRKNHSLIK